MIFSCWRRSRRGPRAHDTPALRQARPWLRPSAIAWGRAGNFRASAGHERIETLNSVIGTLIRIIGTLIRVIGTLIRIISYSEVSGVSDAALDWRTRVERAYGSAPARDPARGGSGEGTPLALAHDGVTHGLDRERP